MGAGEVILPALKRALSSGTHEGSPAARHTLERIERAVREGAHDARERRRSLKLITFDDETKTLGSVLQAIEAELGYTFESKLDLGRKVRVGGADQPLRRVLDSIERQLDVTI
ncbi:MAG TPA: hypothetical protein VJU16_07635, partial [Planctomycetota bacterium]|nr:hypothetical protein [Planctomycetota bacterium]